MTKKRELIIEAAFKVFSEKGYYNTKMDEIAEEASIGKGTIYSYFHNKQDLFDTMVFWFLEKYFDNLDKDADENDSIQIMIQKIILNHINIINKTKATFMNIMTEFSNIPRNKTEIMDFHKDFIFGKLDKYTKIFEIAKNKGELRDINPHLIAGFLLGVLKGISESILLFDKMEDGEKIAKEISDLLCYGIIKNKE